MEPNADTITREQKERFILALLKKPDDAFAAAKVVYGDNVGMALRLSREWQNDPEMLALQDKLLDEQGELAFLPGKAETARTAWEISQDIKLHVDDRLKALKLYAELRNFIEKPNTTVNNQINVANKVMIVKDHGRDEDWEAAAATQQAKLIEDARRDIQLTH